MNWEERERCNQIANFNDTEMDCGATSSNQEYWEAGCHGTGVSSIAIGRNFLGALGGVQLGDTCWMDNPVDPHHCATLSSRSQGMAYGAKGIYIEKSGFAVAPVQTMMNEEVDVITMSFGPGASDPNLCNPMITQSIESELENAFDQGIFVVNSTGNFGATHAVAGYSKTSCLTNPIATKPKVFAVAGILNTIYSYFDRHIHYDIEDPPGVITTYQIDAWEAGYNSNSTLWPNSPDDYFNMRVDPFASHTGGAVLVINNVDRGRALTVVDLVAPQGGFNSTRPEGDNGNLNAFFGGSSGATPHVSGLSLLVKHFFLNAQQYMINNPGWLHTVMLAMGDRSIFDTTNLAMVQKSSGGDRIYGFGKIKLRQFINGNWRMLQKTWTSGTFPGTYYTERVWPSPASSSHTFVKAVMNQIEGMTGKIPTDMVSDFWIQLYQTNQTYSGTCPATYETACVQSGTCTYIYDSSYDVKKMVRLISSNMGGRCHYIKINKRHITSAGASVQLFFYRSNISDRTNSQ